MGDCCEHSLYYSIRKRLTMLAAILLLILAILPCFCWCEEILSYRINSIFIICLNRTIIEDYCLPDPILIKLVYYSITGGGAIALLVLLGYVSLDLCREALRKIILIGYSILTFILAMIMFQLVGTSYHYQYGECYAFPILLLIVSIIMLLDLLLQNYETNDCDICTLLFSRKTCTI